MVLYPDEIEQLSDAASPFHRWLKTFAGSKTAVILLPSKPLCDGDRAIQTIRSLNPETLIVQLPIDGRRCPLKICQHVGLKMPLNAHSTAVMAKLGRVVGNTMTNM